MSNIKNVAIFVDYSQEFARRIVYGFMHYVKSESEFEWRFPLISDRLRDVRVLKGGKNLDGVICPIYSERVSLKLTTLGIPCVNLAMPLTGCTIPAVTFDNYQIGRAAAKHLLSSDAVDYIFICENSAPYNQLRWRGFCEAIEDAGMSARRVLYRVKKKEIEVAGRLGNPSALIPHLKKRQLPLGVFASWDYVGFNVMSALTLAGLECPQQVRVVSVDNDSFYCLLTSPQMSSVDINPESVGYRAGMKLESIFKGEKQRSDDPILIPPGDLAIRGSSDTLHLEHPNIAQAITIINEDFHQGINVGDLVNRMPISRRTLETQFRKVLGKSVHEVILEIRMQKARQLLKRTYLSIDEVSLRVGFKSQQNFHVAFKRETGMSPRDYRKINFMN